GNNRTHARQEGADPVAHLADGRMTALHFNQVVEKLDGFDYLRTCEVRRSAVIEENLSVVCVDEGTPEGPRTVVKVTCGLCGAVLPETRCCPRHIAQLGPRLRRFLGQAQLSKAYLVNRNKTLSGTAN